MSVASRVSDFTETSMTIPAYRYAGGDGGERLVFWCPIHRYLESHGAAGGGIKQLRGHHQTGMERQGPPSVRLVVVGRVTSLRGVPKLSLAEAAEVDALLSPIFAKNSEEVFT